jgi:hypothetical protein
VLWQAVSLAHASTGYFMGLRFGGISLHVLIGCLSIGGIVVINCLRDNRQ